MMPGRDLRRLTSTSIFAEAENLSRMANAPGIAPVHAKRMTANTQRLKNREVENEMLREKRSAMRYGSPWNTGTQGYRPPPQWRLLRVISRRSSTEPDAGRRGVGATAVDRARGQWAGDGSFLPAFDQR